MKKRSYDSSGREKLAAQTRAGILSAAKQMFQVEGFDRVTIQALAKVAGVSVPTIYALFKSKRGVLQALIDEAFPLEQFTALVDGSMQGDSPISCLEITAELACQIYEAEKELMDILRGASLVSSECRDLELEREKRRYDRQEAYIKKLSQEQWLAKGLSLQKARDILWALTGRDLYRMFVVERGWSAEEYKKWLAKTLIASLL